MKLILKNEIEIESENKLMLCTWLYVQGWKSVGVNSNITQSVQRTSFVNCDHYC